MKRLIFFLLCSLFLSCNQNMQDAEIQNSEYIKDVGFFYCICSKPQDELSWNYPFKPSMEEWKQFQNLEEMVSACQIPDNILISLSTKELMIICLQYPLLSNMFAFSDKNLGLENLFDNFNGIRELFDRIEVSKELLTWYNCQIQNFSLLDKKLISEVEKGNFIISISIIEILLSRTTGDYKDILQKLVIGYEKKLEYSSYFEGFGFSTNFFARAHIIRKICEHCLENENTFFSDPIDKQTMGIINELSYQLIN